MRGRQMPPQKGKFRNSVYQWCMSVLVGPSVPFSVRGGLHVSTNYRIS